jgi:hypothetical protein
MRAKFAGGTTMKNESTLRAVRRIARLIALLSYLSGVVLPAASNAAEGDGHRVATMNKMKITIGSKTFTATLYENPTVATLKRMLPLTVEMTELNGNEKYFHLTTELSMDAANPGTIQSGDLMLWQSNSLVLFYETFRTSYSYTKLGRIDDASGLATAVGPGSVKVRLEIERNVR